MDISTLNRDSLKDIGFEEIPHFTIMNSLLYDLGRSRTLSIGSLGTPNEMIFITQSDYDDMRKIEDIITIKNYDYDGYSTLDDVKLIITSITGRIF